MLSRAPQEKEFEACKASAAGSLAYRPHSRSELTTKLLNKGFDKATIERALTRLQELVCSVAWSYMSLETCGLPGLNLLPACRDGTSMHLLTEAS